jgi:hypothetical protein
MNDDDVLAYTRGIRVKVIQKITSNTETQGMPVDNGQANLLTNMLNGLDSQAMGNKRLAQEQRNNDNTAAVVAELLRSIDKNKAFQLAPGDDPDTVDVEARVVPREITDAQAMPGEMDVAPPQLDYASFVRSQGRDIDTIGKDVKHAEADEDEDDGTP